MNAINASDDEALDPAAALALLNDQQRDIARQLASLVPWILFAWGVAWTVGFGMLWLIDGARPAFSVPWPVAAVVFAALNLAALIATAILGVRSGRGIRTAPDAAFTGAVYGSTWTIGFVVIFAFGAALQVNGMDPSLSSIYYPTASAAFVGIMYILAGGIWHTWSMIVLGGWFALVAAVAPFFGYPANYLIFAVAGGGVFLLGALAAWIRIARGAPAKGMRRA
ncbi:hypothetical protein WDJ51_10310 [Rathayibacter sp. YIM 133350]|uniref:hypothetical protein n=1 Tax=Rathayibacter sp. YIM 133350 TaxID=3131992 RepID=UPI00307E1C60